MPTRKNYHHQFKIKVALPYLPVHYFCKILCGQQTLCETKLCSPYSWDLGLAFSMSSPLAPEMGSLSLLRSCPVPPRFAYVDLSFSLCTDAAMVLCLYNYYFPHISQMPETAQGHEPPPTCFQLTTGSLPAACQGPSALCPSAVMQSLWLSGWWPIYVQNPTSLFAGTPLVSVVHSWCDRQNNINPVNT